MHSIGFSVGARRLFIISIIARLSPAMLSIGLLIQAQRLTGSFATAGVVTGAFAIGLGVGGPRLGRLIDHRGQTAVLLASAALAGALLVATAVVPTGTPATALVLLATGIGLTIPPVDACLRTQLPDLLPDDGAVRGAYALEASVMELTYICGPPLALCIAALWSAAAALAVAGVLLMAATAAFALQPASRGWKPSPADERRRRSPLRVPALQTPVLALVLVGVLLGADEVAVTVAAKTLDGLTAAAPLLAIWGAGSFIGGLLVTRPGAAPAPRPVSRCCSLPSQARTWL